jgi:hypothetical protein
MVIYMPKIVCWDDNHMIKIRDQAFKNSFFFQTLREVFPDKFHFYASDGMWVFIPPNPPKTMVELWDKFNEAEKATIARSANVEVGVLALMTIEKIIGNSRLRIKHDPITGKWSAVPNPLVP